MFSLAMRGCPILKKKDNPTWVSSYPFGSIQRDDAQPLSDVRNGWCNHFRLASSCRHFWQTDQSAISKSAVWHSANHSTVESEINIKIRLRQHYGHCLNLAANGMTSLLRLANPYSTNRFPRPIRGPALIKIWPRTTAVKFHYPWPGFLKGRHFWRDPISLNIRLLTGNFLSRLFWAQSKRIC